VEENKTSAKLVNELELRTFRLRVAQTVLIVLVMLGVIFLLVSNSRLQTQNSTLHAQNATLLQSQDKLLQGQQQTLTDLETRIADLQSHIDCIVELFQQPNRASIVISDLTNCKLSTTVSPTSPTSSPPKVAGGSPSQPSPTVTPATQPSLSSPRSQPSSPSASSTPPARSNLKQALHLPSKILKKLGL
jgi:type II secretory pathway pseudopilin PulG